MREEVWRRRGRKSGVSALEHGSQRFGRGDRYSSVKVRNSPSFVTVPWLHTVATTRVTHDAERRSVPQKSLVLEPLIVRSKSAADVIQVGRHAVSTWRDRRHRGSHYQTRGVARSRNLRRQRWIRHLRRAKAAWIQQRRRCNARWLGVVGLE